MLSMSTLILFTGAAFALSLTPGPDMLLIASRTISQGRMAGFASLAGTQAGIYCHALAAAFGLSALFVEVPLAFNVMRYLGAAYLLFLAIKTVRSASMVVSADSTAPPARIRAIFRQGLLTNVLNPKVAIFILALFPQFLEPTAGSVAAQTLVLATVLNLVSLVVNGAVVVFAATVHARWQARQTARRPSRVPQWALGAVFAGLALRLAADGRN